MTDEVEPPVQVLLESSVAHTKECLSRSPESVIITSPYLTSTIAEDVIGKCDPTTCIVLTTFRAENFAAGASSLATLRRLLERGFNVRHLDALHAKVVLTKDHCLVGSQNLTAGGTQNREATAVIHDSKLSEFVAGQLKHWIEQSQPVSIEMLEEMERQIGPLIETSGKLRQRAAEINDQVRSGEVARQSERQRLKAAEQDELATQKEQDWLRLATEANAPLQAAIRSIPILRSVRLSKQFVSSSSSWLTTLRAPPKVDLTNWAALDDGPLTRRERYLLIVPRTSKLAWVALNKTRLTQFGTGVERKDRRVSSKLQWLVRDIEFNKELETLSGWNVRFTLTLDGSSRTPNYALRCLMKFTVQDLQLVKFDHIRRPVIADQFERQFSAPNSLLRSGLTRQLIKPFRYTENSAGIDANEFCRGLGDRFVLHLQTHQLRPFFVLEPR